MAPPTPLECSNADCDFTTPQGCPTWEIMANLLQQHTQAVHSAGAQQGGSTVSKLEKLPRPVFSLNMTESQWSFKRMQWDNYIKQSTVPESVKLMQLQAACDEALRQRIFDTGAYASLTTEELFLKKMKELALASRISGKEMFILVDQYSYICLWVYVCACGDVWRIVVGHPTKEIPEKNGPISVNNGSHNCKQ